ncbi:hypothetical protein J2Y66_004124 [Paenarthrobacter nitroguajacolicus]|uniref:hypothetical protein n=1 Tax=Paenarthrobacter nitroguajacolicus TaxID=211146 RepID=UPI00285F5262|nr:hypothetical protein [Paenarthrobacter nitroguajacolicus]MDR6989607.1 hypothetical protein [Paenarthrobacter nitroguajacolicus]
MAERIVEIISHVLRDVSSSGLQHPRIDETDWCGDPQVLSAMIYSVRDSSGQGVSVRRDISQAAQLVSVADQVQEWVIEENSLTNSNWPQCPWHPSNHPLTARLVDNEGVWACPALSTPAAVIGELGAKGSED